jgi:DNA-binding protein H-NS
LHHPNNVCPYFTQLKVCGRTVERFHQEAILNIYSEQIALNTSATSASKITDIKLAVDIIKSLPTDLQRTFPNLSGQLNTMVHNMHSLLKSNDQHLREYIQKTKEHLQTVQRTQEMLQEYGSDEEKKLQKRVIDSINDRLEKLQKLQALFGDD